MSFKLVESGWTSVLRDALDADDSKILIVCPFIKGATVARLLEGRKPREIQVITRFNVNEFAVGVSDISALKLLLKRGAEIRGIKHLHTKMYLFGARSSVVGSANLTESALRRNHEFGFVANDDQIGCECRKYFQRLWASAALLKSGQLSAWEQEVADFKKTVEGSKRSINLGDFGADIGIIPDSSDEFSTTAPTPGSIQSFIKFLGKGDNRAPRNLKILDLIKRSDCHRLVAYPKNKRPRRLNDGATIYLGWLVSNKSDILIFGKALGQRYRPTLDDATPTYLKKHPRMKKWPHYVRLSDAEFLDGEIGNGVSMRNLMDTLASRSFASTKRNAKSSDKNVDPRMSVRQQPAVELSPEAAGWLEVQLSKAFEVHGRLSYRAIEKAVQR